MGAPPLDTCQIKFQYYSEIENIVTDVEELYQRFDKLNKNYYKKAISTSNELILDLINNYKLTIFQLVILN